MHLCIFLLIDFYTMLLFVLYMQSLILEITFKKFMLKVMLNLPLKQMTFSLQNRNELVATFAFNWTVQSFSNKKAKQCF